MMQALLAAVLFGASAPLSKLLLGKIEPVLLAALMYLGGGAGLLLLRVLRALYGRNTDTEARLGKSDAPWLAGSLLAGGVAAPIILLFSLRSTPASTASLLLNFEGVATALIAAAFFNEAVGRRVWTAVAFITGASALLSLDLGGVWGVSPGALGVLAACALWGLDNNFTRNVSAKDPVVIVIFKATGAGLFSLALALILSVPVPGPWPIVSAMILGFFSYGLSIVLFILSMRSLGAARTSALFGTGPFIGVIISFAVLKESPNILFLVSIPIMALGAALLLGEKHGHKHIHEAVVHEHRHHHEDGHHAHRHQEKVAAAHAHSHPHEHETAEHDHIHTPDIHHRHK